MRTIALLTALATSSCGGASGVSQTAYDARQARARADDWVVVTVYRARISEQVDSGTTWDPDVAGAQAEHDRQSAEAAATMLGLASPLAGAGLRAFAAMSAERPSSEVDPTHPDVLVEIAWSERGSERSLASTVVHNNVRPIWGTQLLLRVGDLDDEGLRLRVRDDDGPQSQAPVIGEVRIPASTVRDVQRSGRNAELTLTDHELLELHVHMRPVRDSEAFGERELDLSLRDGLAATDTTIAAGTWVRVEAFGVASVGAGWACPSTVSPVGLSGSQCRSYNLRLDGLRDAPHGAAAVLVGVSPRLEAHPLVDWALDDTACVEFLSAVPGPLVVGVNDNEFRNNSGSFRFHVTYGVPPTVAAHLAPGEARPCGAGSDEDWIDGDL